MPILNQSKTLPVNFHKLTMASCDGTSHLALSSFLEAFL